MTHSAPLQAMEGKSKTEITGSRRKVLKSSQDSGPETAIPDYSRKMFHRRINVPHRVW
jgi:hypothetical protein